MSEPKKHHYIPAFYLAAWAGPNGNLCEYSRPYREVTPRWCHPNATGYQNGLYTLQGLPPEEAQAVEKYLMGSTDDGAAKVHRLLLSWSKDGFQDLTPTEKITWARFLYALVFRTPDQIDNLRLSLRTASPDGIEEWRTDYDTIRSPSDPLTFEEFKERYLANPTNSDPMWLLIQLLNSKYVLRTIASMAFRTFTLSGRYAGPTFLTSDRPFIMTNGLSQADDYIALPLTPTVLFLAEKADLVYKALSNVAERELVRRVNERVCEQSSRYVYGNDASQLRFVEKRLGRKVKASPLG